MSLNDHLSELLDSSVARLPAVTKRRMFGCDAWFASGKIFALIWKGGRVGIKLTAPPDYEALMATDGAEPWSPDGKVKMSGWVLAPESLHDDTEELDVWVKRAHAQAMSAPAKPSKAPRKPASKGKSKAR